MKQERPYPIYTVSRKAEHSISLGHPWVYAEEITALPEAEPENGALVDAVSSKGRYLGTGFLSKESKIRIRLISRNANDRFDQAFWRRRVEYAWAYRRQVMGPEDLDCCRVIFGEADQFPGLTVDRFHDHSGHPDSLLRAGAAQGADFSPSGGSAAAGRPGHPGHLRAQRRSPSVPGGAVGG